MEVLSDILRTMRVEGSVYFCDMLDAPWTKEWRDTTSASFHMIRRGECWATVGDQTEYLGPGDLIFTGTSGTTSALRPRDVVEVELESVGVLRNRVGSGPGDALRQGLHPLVFA